MKTKDNPLKGYLQLIALFFGVLATAAGVVYYSYLTLNKPYTEKKELPVESNRILDPAMVCMVNNAYMGSFQIPVQINDEVYYGCCDGCVTTLKTNPESRFALDPLTNERVDKATALITLDPHGKSTVLYFKNEKNVKDYFSVKY